MHALHSAHDGLARIRPFHLPEGPPHLHDLHDSPSTIRRARPGLPDALLRRLPRPLSLCRPQQEDPPLCPLQHHAGPPPRDHPHLPPDPHVEQHGRPDPVHVHRVHFEYDILLRRCHRRLLLPLQPPRRAALQDPCDQHGGLSANRGRCWVRGLVFFASPRLVGACGRFRLAHRGAPPPARRFAQSCLVAAGRGRGRGRGCPLRD
mmetsp:Transcript_19029/g.43842  ORF Transcript_19029/g.43842 Transcript_19029/m.43842 type:complete len:205 (+) Transcript_19029:320-934(+)